MADVTPPDAHRPRTHEHTKRCYWDLQECRWVCQHEPESRPDETSADPGDGQ